MSLLVLLAIALVLAALPLSKSERNSLLFMLSGNIIKGLVSCGSLFANCAGAQQPEDMRDKDAYFQDTTSFFFGWSAISKFEPEEAKAHQMMYKTPPRTSKVFCATVGGDQRGIGRDKGETIKQRHTESHEGEKSAVPVHGEENLLPRQTVSLFRTLNMIDMACHTHPIYTHHSTSSLPNLPIRR